MVFSRLITISYQDHYFFIGNKFCFYCQDQFIMLDFLYLVWILNKKRLVHNFWQFCVLKHCRPLQSRNVSMQEANIKSPKAKRRRTEEEEEQWDDDDDDFMLTQVCFCGIFVTQLEVSFLVTFSTFSCQPVDIQTCTSTWIYSVEHKNFLLCLYVLVSLKLTKWRRNCNLYFLKL